MSRFERSIPPAYFDALYAEDADPWRFVTSPYERAKYAATLAALPRRRYAHVLEVGCSIGVLTRLLAARCDRLLAIDAARAAIDEARRRCADLPQVSFERCCVPAGWPSSGRFDLVVLSEVVYYLDRADIDALAERVADTLAPGGDIVLVHWLGETHYPLTGDEAADHFLRAAAPWSATVDRSRTDEYRLDLLSGVTCRSNPTSRRARRI